MGYSFQKAKKEKIWVKALLVGSSGSGKSYSALRLATGLYKKVGGTGIAVIDTESGRIKYYANEFNFDVLELDEPFMPEKYIEAIDAAVDAGYKVIIIDSTSHEWNYLTQQAQSSPNGFNAWAKLKPRHRRFTEKILNAPAHIIATGRGKDEYVVEEKNGKNVPKKVGVGVQQEKDAEYEYTITFNIIQDTHIAESTKDNTHIFDGKFEVLTEKHGEALYDWANSGDTPAPKSVKAEDTRNLKEVLEEIKATFEDGINKGLDKEAMYKIVADNTPDNKKNFMLISDIDVAEFVLGKIVEFVNPVNG